MLEMLKVCTKSREVERELVDDDDDDDNYKSEHKS